MDNLLIIGYYILMFCLIELCCFGLLFFTDEEFKKSFLEDWNREDK